MTIFPKMLDDDYAVVYLEDTDKALPLKLNQSTRYVYFKTIARGGRAIIQSCKDRYLSRTICYKKLRPEFADDLIEQKRFLREARINALLQHPNTVPTYELGRDIKGHYYFTMKLVRGYTLREILNYRERYDLKQLINVIIQVAYALEYAHSHHVVHRDIKPENVLVGPFGEVLLMDWGLAKVWRQTGGNDESVRTLEKMVNKKVNSMTDADELQGTIAYMSPEQIQRTPDIDYRTDIYSLGVILYEILASRLPFAAETVDEMSQKILNEDPPDISSFSRTPIPNLLETVTMACLLKPVKNRMQSCRELVRLLREDWG